MRKLSMAQTVVILVVTCTFTLMGFAFGFYFGTGMLPTFTRSEAVLPPKTVESTMEEVQITLEEIPVEEYRFGYNCVDFALTAQRALAWQGRSSAAVIIVLSPGPNHALLLTATSDAGWTFIEPSTGTIVRPVIGGVFGGQHIESIKVLTWIPLDEWLQSPVFEEIVSE